MVTLSLCMIVRNEEETLGMLLDRVKGIVDEMIVIDTGSTDKTMSLASAAGAKVYPYFWCDDFSTARNEAFSKATSDYILWLDADDYISEATKEEMVQFKEVIDQTIDIFFMPYDILDEQGKCIKWYWRERVIRNNAKLRWEEPVHEAIVPYGKVKFENIRITHKRNHKNHNERNLSIYRKWLAAGHQLTQRGTLYYSKELYEAGAYKEAEAMLEDLVQGEEVPVLYRIDGLITLAYCKKELGEDYLAILYRSFKYDQPRGDICYTIAHLAFEKKCYQEAIFWYTLGLKLPKQADGFSIYGIENEAYIVKKKMLTINNIEETGAEGNRNYF